ncbi:hypothetical protein [Hymenobacter elongatus]|uniref:Uncharacterized protein n=1 Tax=Hymenobacter elongatus TaxID=877208 RepID=A0A4Z0PI02_9BACT|nr:hypothetical protein [Hymenobacter elongatus]TGE14820.1 hypothetical protein E5J99_14415 [Hymenobacter elongatus]
MSKHQDKAPTNSEKSKERAEAKQHPEANEQNQEAANHKGEAHSNSGGTQMQNVNQNGLNEAGNPTKNSTPGDGNNEDQRTSPVNKPRNNPQGNKPMSVDGSQKGPGRDAD